ncbi:hypothetical protein J4Q44_G00348950 [Coregonus suidteri]|uniref:Uncharacterized protein n=1 Tax=Coregonus suidteri TaxID=861788 RepID=A0AAN8Q7K2_9TELE
MSDKKMSSSRKQHLKSLMLQIAQGLIEAEAIQAEEEKNRYMDENVPSLSIPGHMQELQIEDLKIPSQDLKGKFKKPVLKKVMSADAMLQALLGSKSRKRWVKDAADWRKNIEDKAGMDGRKKMFESDP